MTFDKALTEVFSGKRAFIKSNKESIIVMRHNIITRLLDGQNYRPTVTEMHHDAWEVTNASYI